MEKKKIALMAHLGCEESELVEFVDEGLFSFHTQQYLVMTDEEADVKCKYYIRESLWAFNSSFLENYCVVPESVLRCMQSLHEECNEAIYELVKDRFDDLVQHAISSDGRGHFMTSYDGEETEQGEFFIYRMG